MNIAEDKSYLADANSIEIHAAANKVRMMDTTEYETLLNDIRANGQLVPAVLLEGQLIDGRNRMKACQELGIELMVEEHTSPAPDPIRLVWSYNAARRNLTKGQKAALASDMANVTNMGRPPSSGPKISSSKKTTLPESTKPVTQQEASETFGVDSSQLRKFRAIEAKEPETAKNIREGNASVESSYNDMKKREKAASAPAEQEKVVPITRGVKIGTTDASWDDLLAAVNISTETIDTAKEDMMHPQYMVARRLSESKERIVKAMTPLSKQERQKSLNAVVEVLVYEQEVFQAEVKALMPKYNKALESRLKDEIEAQKAITADLRKKIGAGFDKKDFKVVRGVLHSDREPTKAQRDNAFNLFLKLEPIFS